MNKLYLLLAFVGLVFTSCNDNGGKNAQAPKHTGKLELRVDADEDLEPVMSKQAEVFEYAFDTAKLTMAYKNEAAILEDFKTKKTDVLVLSRDLTEAEKQNLKTVDTIYVREVRVANDAVALIGSKQFDDSKLDMDVLKKSFAPTAEKGIQMVFANQNSGVVNYVLKTLGFNSKVSSNVYALKSVEEVIKYVKENKAIGFLPYNLLGDENNEEAKGILKEIKILSLSVKDSTGKILRVSANQSDIATGDYPLIRGVNVVTRYDYAPQDGLFANFLFRGKGARIFLKAGLIPISMPVRDIEVNTDGLKGKN